MQIELLLFAAAIFAAGAKSFEFLHAHQWRQCVLWALVAVVIIFLAAYLT